MELYPSLHFLSSISTLLSTTPSPDLPCFSTKVPSQSTHSISPLDLLPWLLLLTLLLPLPPIASFQMDPLEGEGTLNQTQIEGWWRAQSSKQTTSSVCVFVTLYMNKNDNNKVVVFGSDAFFLLLLPLSLCHSFKWIGPPFEPFVSPKGP